MDSFDVAGLRDITYVQMRLLQARIELEAMIAENQFRKSCDLSPAYKEEHFMNLIEKHEIHHNGVVSQLYQHQR